MDRAFGLRDLGNTMVLQRRFREGAELYEESVPLFREFAGETSPELWRAVAFLGDARSWEGRFAEGEALLRQAVDRLAETAGPRSYQIRMPRKLLAETLRKKGALAEAVAMFLDVRGLEVELFETEDHRDIAVTDRRLGVTLMQVGSPESLAEARRRLDNAVLLDRKYRAGAVGLGETLVASAAQRLASGGDPNLARAELAEAAAIFAAKLAADDSRRLEAAALQAALAPG
jgi:hypothetical protein